MATVLLIDSNYLKAMTTVNGSVDDNLVLPSVNLAQDKYVEEYLGTDLMVKLKTDHAAGTTSGNYLTLLNTYVQPCVVWFTMVELLPNLCFRVDNGTLVQRQSEDTVPVSTAVMNDMIDRAMSNSRYYATRMVDYLCHNSSLFPEYTSNQFPDRAPNTDVNKLFNYSYTNGNTSMSVAGNWPLKRLSQLP